MEEALVLDVEKVTTQSDIPKELLPRTEEEKDWGIGKFATLWMGSVHNILSYMTVAGFFVLGLSSKQVFAAVMTSALIVSTLYVINGVASAKYGIPFTMVLRSVFGKKGSIIPALARGLIAVDLCIGGTKVIDKLGTYASPFMYVLSRGAASWASFSSWSAVNLFVP